MREERGNGREQDREKKEKRGERRERERKRRIKGDQLLIILGYGHRKRIASQQLTALIETSKLLCVTNHDTFHDASVTLRLAKNV